MYLEILLTIWFVLWLIIKIGLFPDIIKNSLGQQRIKKSKKQIQLLLKNQTIF